MVKRILVVLEDAEFEKLSAMKGERTWKDAIRDAFNAEKRTWKDTIRDAFNAKKTSA